ncbi:MAG: PQQ-binding-like beta-propeller repeat protein [Clostridia bacterium]
MSKKIQKFATLAAIIIIVLCGCAASSSTDTKKTAETFKAGVFPTKYTETDGVLTFRGNNFRNAPAFGTVSLVSKTISQLWSVSAPGNGSIWGGGSCWTGQPALVHWSDTTKHNMNLKAKFKSKKDFVEVIIGTMSGKVYFLDLQTGEQTRNPIDTKNPIKGSVSVDARGYPLLYVGQGIDTNGRVGVHLYNLINQKELYYINVHDSRAPRSWPGCDSSALFNRADDTLFIPAENGLVYKLKLNTKYNATKGTLTIKPTQTIFNTKASSTSSASSLGIENSAAAYKNLLFFGDNVGMIRCITTSMKLKWKYKNLDDTDASIVLEIENGKPVLYTGCQVDKQGSPGYARFVKLDATTGKVIWKRDFKCYSRYGSSPSNGGFLGTPVIGKKDLSKLLVFTLCRYPDFSNGTMFAVNKSNGKVAWQNKMTTYAWSSPVDVYTAAGKGYIVHVDRSGNARIIDGKSGKILYTKNFDSYVEASPAMYNNYLVIASRNSKIYGFKLK